MARKTAAKPTGDKIALSAMRDAIAKGEWVEAKIISAGAAALGGDEAAQIVADMVWRRDFGIAEAN